MNIKDVPQNQNIENGRTQSLISYAVQQKSESKNFSYYVETTKTQEVKNQLKQNENDENQDNSQDELALQLQNSDEGTQLAYVQSLQNLNSDLFNLGIANSDNENNFNSDMFKYNVNLSDLTQDDIKLFEGLTQKTDLAVNSFDAQKQTFNMTLNGEGLNISYRSLEVSKTLFSAIENASKTGKPVRLDFGKDASVILKISKDGKLSADFIPNDKAMEIMLKNALPELKAKFDNEKLPYNELNYRNFNQQKQNQKENKEKNKDE